MIQLSLLLWREISLFLALCFLLLLLPPSRKEAGGGVKAGGEIEA